MLQVPTVITHINPRNTLYIIFSDCINSIVYVEWLTLSIFNFSQELHQLRVEVSDLKDELKSVQKENSCVIDKVHDLESKIKKEGM